MHVRLISDGCHLELVRVLVLYLLAQVVELLADDMMSGELFGGRLRCLRMDGHEQSHRHPLQASLSLLRRPLV